jgi:short-subunit dehydrogenase
VLVNSAGIALSGPFARMDADALATMVRVNVNALTDLARAVLPSMLEQKSGRILNVASLAGFQPGGPGMAAYYATKSYVVSFSRALARELRGSGVTVTALCPGPTRTEMGDLAGLNDMRLFRWLPPMDARTVAAAGLRAMQAGRTVAVPGLLNKVLSLAGRLPPAALSIEVNRLLLR